MLIAVWCNALSNAGDFCKWHKSDIGVCKSGDCQVRAARSTIAKLGSLVVMGNLS